MSLFLLAATPVPDPPWFVCDGIDRPVVLVVGATDARGDVAVRRVAKPSGRSTTATYRLGPADPGAGQIYHALSVAGREVGNIHFANPGMVEPPATATTPVATSVTLNGEAIQCRWLANTVIDGVTGLRGVNVARDGGVLVYRTFDFAKPRPVVSPDGIQRMTIPTLTVRGGSSARSGDGGSVYRFAAKGWIYSITVPAAGRPSLTVMRGRRIVQREAFLAATVAR